MSSKKFTELLSANALTSADIIAIVDDQNTSSRKITASDVSNYVYSPTVLSDANIIQNLTSALGGSDDTTSNNLKSGLLFYDGAYRTAEYFLNYDNLDGAPSRVVNNSLLANTENFVSLRVNQGASGNKTLEVRQSSVAGAQATVVNTDHIAEGTDKLFYSDLKVSNAIESNFGRLFNQYSNVFDGGNVIDSLQDVEAQWIPNAGSPNTSFILQVTDSNLEIQDSFSKGQILRVFGGNKTANDNTFDVSIEEVKVANGIFEEGTVTDNPALKLRYKIAYFDLQTGKIGKRTTTAQAIIKLSSAASGETDTIQTIRNSFNTSNFLSIKIASLVSNQGVVIYRQEGGTGNYDLVAVLGPKDFNGNTWRDYYNFDYVSWSGKDPVDNSYLPEAVPSKLVGGRNVIHFPQSLGTADNPTDPSNSTRLCGWCDVEILEDPIKQAGGVIQLIVGSALDQVTINGVSNPVISNNKCYIVHNDTTKLQNAITSKSLADQRSLNLNAKTYNVSHLSVPSFFGLTGVPGITQIRKIPFSGYTGSNVTDGSPDNSVIKGTFLQDQFGPTQISLLGIDFEGNNRNQYLLNDTIGNTFIDFGTQSTGVLIQNCRIKNLVGEGINASSPTAFKLVTSEISDSAVSDRHEFSPLTVDDGENTIVTGNIIQNFTNFIDASVTKQGVIANNIIKNLTGNIQDGDETTDLGSAIFTYGSTFLISSPNVMMGPSNEFLSSPDIFNSEYDAVNLLRSAMQSQAGLPSGVYTSDAFVYQENGSVFDLSQDTINPAVGGTISYNTNLIRKLGASSSSTEEVYGDEVGPGARDIRNNSYLTSNIPNYGLISGETYEIRDVGNCDWTKAGAIVNMVGTDFVYNGTTLEQKGSTTLPTSGKVSPGYATPYQDRGTQSLTGVTGITTGGVIAQAGTSVTITDKVTVSATTPAGAPNINPGTYQVTNVNANGNEFTIAGAGEATSGQITAGGVVLHKVVVQDRLQIENVSGDAGIDKTRGEFKLNITNVGHGSLDRLLTGGFSAGELQTIFDSQIRASEADASKLHPPASYHVGVAWSASYRYGANAGSISSVGTWGDWRVLDSNGLDQEAGAPQFGKNVARGTEVDLMNAGRAYQDFTVDISNPAYLTVGRKVIIKDKTSFSVGNSLNTYGIVLDISGEGATKTLIIRFFASGANTYASSDPGNNEAAGSADGTINIIDDFVMTQGLIK